jgi:hypothetical protein
MKRILDTEAMEGVISTAPRLSRALAILNMPLWDHMLEIPAGETAEVTSVLNWPEAQKAMIETAAGPTMNSAFRQYILETIDETSLKQAHADCVGILGHPELVLSPPIRERRLEHLLGAGSYPDVALEEAIILCRVYREMNRPAAILNVFEAASDLYLPEPTLLIVAWAYLRLGRIEEAQAWLPENGLTDPLDIAWRHYIQSEIYKGASPAYFSRDKALAEIETAIRICQEAGAEEPGNGLIRQFERAYRQDMARIQQFLFLDLEKAAQEYNRLVTEWRDQPGIELIAAQRDYAGCLRKLSAAPGDREWLSAKSLLREAEGLAKDYQHAPVLAEVLYEKAKIAEAEGRLADADKLVREALGSARKSQHYMLVAIAENRIFWNSEPFSLARWQAIKEALRQFSHHWWAMRTLINGRLRADQALSTKQ